MISDMDNALPTFRVPSLPQWRELAMPKEHGSWSLALEPLMFGLIATPSIGGGWLALAVVAGFFARRPMRIAYRDKDAARRLDAFAVLVVCSLCALFAFAMAMHVAGTSWLWWLAPSAIAGGVFVTFDLRNGGREEVAEIAGSSAFAFLPAALAALNGVDSRIAFALAVVMCGRAVPTVLCVRAALRGAKTGIRRPVPALVAASAAVVASIELVRHELAPVMAVVALVVLMVRAIVLLAYPRPPLRARTIGMIEAVLGVVFVIAVACSWSA